MTELSKAGTFKRWLHFLVITICLVVVSVEFFLLLMSIIAWADYMTMSLAEWPWYCRLFLLAWATCVAWAVDQAYRTLDMKREQEDATTNS